VIAAYADDIHLIGSPATVGLALSSLTQLSSSIKALSLDCRLSSLGLALSPGKTSILLGKEATPQALEAVASALTCSPTSMPLFAMKGILLAQATQS